MEREASYLTLFVPIDVGIGTVPVNRAPDDSLYVSKVVTVAQRFGRLSNIHGHRLLSFLPQNQSDDHGDSHLTKAVLQSEQMPRHPTYLLIYQTFLSNLLTTIGLH
jgi:hypothetical protein